MVEAPIVALVDDETALRETLTIALTREGYRTVAYASGTEAWEAFQRQLPDAAVLDVNMPGLDGLELCRRLKVLSPDLPLVFLSSRDEELDRILGLELGADDYVTKPFSLRELLVRLKVVLRRSRREAVSAATILHLDEEAFVVAWRGQSVPLTVTEFRMVAHLFRQPGYARTRDQLIQAAYPDHTFVDSRTVDTHIKRIRRKFEALDAGFEAIVAVPGLGYRGVLP